jgi:heavy metal translocating P-type ATPase
MKIAIPAFTVLAIILHLVLKYIFVSPDSIFNLPLLAALVLGGVPLVLALFKQAWAREFSSDLLAGIAILTAVALGEYLAGVIVVLMLSGGQLLEEYARVRASGVLAALAKRFPKTAHRRENDQLKDVAVEDIGVGDVCVLYPHETCPVDGVVIEGQGEMDESYLTGEPYKLRKTPGAEVISGAVNGNSALTIRASKLSNQSRFAQIVEVLKKAEQQRPNIRRLGDELGAWYTPIALGIAIAAAYFSGDFSRFLAVLVVATPCPLIIGIPVAIIASISLAAKRSIIIRNPAALEKMNDCKIIILDKTGTLTYGEPIVTDVVSISSHTKNHILSLTASLEQYSKHPLSGAVLREAQKLGVPLYAASSVSEPPGVGLLGRVYNNVVEVTSRKLLERRGIKVELPSNQSGLECVVLINGEIAGLIRFHDAPRKESQNFVRHLATNHGFQKVMIVSGDRESEVRYLADQVGITDVRASHSPEQKVQVVQEHVAMGPTLFIGDGINDAPALVAATVGIAFGQNSDVTSEAGAAVILEQSLKRVDELFHISHRMKRIAKQSAIGGMAASIVGMGFAAFGLITPVMGALIQEGIDIFAILNSLRASFPPAALSDIPEE